MIRNVLLFAAAVWTGFYIAGERKTVSVAANPAEPAIVEQTERSRVPAIPDAEPGVADLKFSELYQTPVGPRGLELSERVKQLEGKRVRILGYMVHSVHPMSRGFILSPYPVIYDKCTADSLPTTSIYVVMPSPVKAGYTEGMLLLTGKLSLGAKEDLYGQVSHIRLLLDPPPASRSQAVPLQTLAQ